MDWGGGCSGTALGGADGACSGEAQPEPWMAGAEPAGKRRWRGSRVGGGGRY
jgi:hypothetical protein